MRRISLARDGVVGRDPQAAVPVGDARISRRHAMLRRHAEGWSLEVLRTVTHEGLVKHNGHVLPRGHREQLHGGDSLTFGTSPEHVVSIEGGRLHLDYSEETMPVAADLGRLPRALVHPASQAPPDVRSRFEVIDPLAAPVDARSVDAVLVMADRVEAVSPLLAELRSRRFFLPIALVGEDLEPRWPWPLQGESYLWLEAADLDVGPKLLLAATINGELERQTLPFLTADVLYLDIGRDRVSGHDWTRHLPRDLALPTRHHQILMAIALHQRERLGSSGLTMDEIAKDLDRETSTLRRELENELPQALVAQGLHPQLFQLPAEPGGRYGLSTPPHCLRELT